jgi:glycerol-3-phosphate O-acyltransferase
MSFRPYKFFRRLLFLWVKVEVFTKDTLPLEFDSTQPVVYVLADRGLSDLLVLSHTTDSRRLPSPLDSLSITPDHRYSSVYCVTSRNIMIEW